MAKGLVLPGFCPECSTKEVLKPGHTEPTKMHAPHCTKGRCGATWNPGVWPYTTRCVIVGKDGHGDKHDNGKGSMIPGDYITVDQELEERNG